MDGGFNGLNATKLSEWCKGLVFARLSLPSTWTLQHVKKKCNKHERYSLALLYVTLVHLSLALQCFTFTLFFLYLYMHLSLSLFIVCENGFDFNFTRSLYLRNATHNSKWAMLNRIYPTCLMTLRHHQNPRPKRCHQWPGHHRPLGPQLPRARQRVSTKCSGATRHPLPPTSKNKIKNN